MAAASTPKAAVIGVGLAGGSFRREGVGSGVALEANRVSHTNRKGEQTGPTLSSRALAIVHVAMYDAFVGAS